MPHRPTSRIARSQDRERLETPRRRDLRALPDSPQDAPSRSERRPYRSSRHAVLATLRDAESGSQGAETAEVARRILCVYRGAVRELGAAGAGKGPTVHGYLIAHATQLVLSQRLAMQAFAAGLGSPQGIELVQQSQRAQGRSERSWVAAVSAAGLLRGRAPDPGSEADVPWLVASDDEGEQ